MRKCGNRIVLLAVAIGLPFAASVCADDNVQAVQTKLRDAGFYMGAIDGAYSSELAAALSRYQIRNGLPITGHLDVDTAKALGVKLAVTNSSSVNQPRKSEVWERLRKSDQQFPGKTVWRAPTQNANETQTGMPLSTPTVTVPRAASAKSSPQESLASQAQGSSQNEEPASTPPAAMDSEKLASTPPAIATGSPSPDFSTERLRDYVGAFVLAGLDPQVGAEAAFFAEHVQYYNEGMKNRQKIRADLKRYDSRWPGRKFWLAGDITVEPQTDNRVRVTFPLRFELRNGAKHSSGKVNKTLLLERAGGDLQIIAVNERKIE